MRNRPEARRKATPFLSRDSGCRTLAGVAALAALIAGPARAEDLALDEIVVSANRIGDTALQRTPIAMSVITPQALDSKGLSGIADFVQSLPSVNMQSISPGENDIEMRGLVVNAVNPTDVAQRSLVAVYLDDAAITQQGFNPDLHVYDLERVEVIRGPQGTLYGAGSMAGTIRLITKKPDAQSFLGDADLSVSHTDHGGTNYSVRGMVNIPLVSDVLAARLVGYRSDDSGYIDNAGLGIRDANPNRATQARLALRWTPSAALTLDGSATFARLNALGRNAVYPEVVAYTYTSLSREQFSDYFKLFNVTADWDLQFAHLVSSSSYIQRDLNQYESFEFLDQALLNPGAALVASNSNANHIHEFQQEVRLISRPDQALRWIVGAYFERDSRFYPQNLVSPGFDAVFGGEIGDPTFTSQTYYGTPANDTPFYGTISNVERQFALFGEVTYAVLANLDVTAGLRYFNFKDDFNLYFTGAAGAIEPGIPDVGSGTERSSGANPRGVVSFRITDDVMVYAEAARGFRYGGVNEPAPTEFCANDLAGVGLTESPKTFSPDSVWSYTVGEKSTLGNGRLLLNVDGFYVDWRNVQVNHDLDCGYFYAENAGKVRSQGVELESKLRVTSALTMSLSGSFTDAKAAMAIPDLGASKGTRAPYFPRTIVTVAADYGIPLPVGKLALAADFTYRSNAYTQFSTANDLYREIPSSKLLNASVGYEAAHWSVSVYGTNLSDDRLVSRVDANTFPGVQPGDTQYWGRPRTIGVHLHASF